MSEIIKKMENGNYCKGYMGATAWEGNKSYKRLRGKELSKAIREELKIAKIKGVSVKCTTYTNGQRLEITIKANPTDYVSKEEFINNYDVNEMLYTGLIYDVITNEYGRKEYLRNMDTDAYYDLSREEREEKFKCHANWEYERLREKKDWYACDGTENVFNYEFKEKVKKIRNIISAYKYDRSNAMVDYHECNFYDRYYIKPVEPYLSQKDYVEI